MNTSTITNLIPESNEPYKNYTAYTTYNIAILFETYWIPILVPLGLSGNFLSTCVMLKPSNRVKSTCIYMCVISINDNIILLLAFHEWIITVPLTHVWNVWECKVTAALILMCLQQSTFLVSLNMKMRFGTPHIRVYNFSCSLNLFWYLPAPSTFVNLLLELKSVLKCAIGALLC